MTKEIHQKSEHTSEKKNQIIKKGVDNYHPPRSGAGKDGTKELADNYSKATPGQKGHPSFPSFKQFLKDLGK